MFSVVVPVWNKRPTLARTVRSVLTQTYPSFELIIVDDGSTDDGLLQLTEFSDSRIRVVRQANAGAGAARNRGVAEAQHDWVAFLDADDLWLPDHLAELDLVRSLHPEAALIGTAFIDSDMQGRFRVPPQRDPVIETICYFSRFGRGEPVFHTSSVAIQKPLCSALGGFRDFRVGEDIEFWARIAFSLPVARSTRATVIYVHGTGGASESATGRWRELRSIEDLSPSVALVIQRYPAIESAELRDALDRFVDRYLDWCLRTSIRIRDFRTLRILPQIYPRRPPLDHRVLLAIGRLPAPLAGALYRLGFAAKAILRLLRLAPLRP